MCFGRRPLEEEDGRRREVVDDSAGRVVLIRVLLDDGRVDHRGALEGSGLSGGRRRDDAALRAAVRAVPVGGSRRRGLVLCNRRGHEAAAVTPDPAVLLGGADAVVAAVGVRVGTSGGAG